MQQNYDIIIIGTGAGGGTLAYALASTGKRILLLKRGEYIPREKQNWNAASVYGNGLYRTEQRWLNSQNKNFQPTLYHKVGGSTKIYGAALLRMRREDFDEIQHYEGISPAWDLKYEDFEPYYNQAEKLYKVHEKRGEDPREPPDSKEYHYPALPHEPRIKQVAQNLEKLGLKPFSLPMRIDRDINNPPQSAGSPEDAKPLGHVHLMGKHKLEMMCDDFSPWVPNSLLKVFASHSVDWWMQSEDLPNIENRVEIAKNKQIKVYYRPNNQKAHRPLRHQFEKVLGKAGLPIIFGIPMPLKIVNNPALS